MRKYIQKSFNGCMQVLLVCLTFMMSACNNDAETVMNASGENMSDLHVNALVDNSMSIGTDESNFTRAGGDNRIPTGYSLRIILEFYVQEASGDFVESPALRKVVYSHSYTDNYVEDIRLPQNFNYKMVAWADYVPDSEGLHAGDYFYQTSSEKGLREIRQIVPDNFDIMQQVANGNDADDAYCGNLMFSTSDSDVDLNITLKRPLCKLTLKNVAFKSDDRTFLNVSNAVMQFDTPLYVAYDAMTGDAILGDETDIYSLFPMNYEIGNGIDMHHYFFVPNQIPQGGLLYGISIKAGEDMFKIDPMLLIALPAKNTSITVSKKNNGTINFMKF